MEPTIEQLQAFYRFVWRSVRKSLFISYVEFGENRHLIVYAGKYDDENRYTGFYISIKPTGEFNDE
jgi:hypothetical protein